MTVKRLNWNKITKTKGNPWINFSRTKNNRWLNHMIKGWKSLKTLKIMSLNKWNSKCRHKSMNYLSSWGKKEKIMLDLRKKCKKECRMKLMILSDNYKKGLGSLKLHLTLLLKEMRSLEKLEKLSLKERLLLKNLKIRLKSWRGKLMMHSIMELKAKKS